MHLSFCRSLKCPLTITPVLRKQKAFIIEGITYEHILCSPAVLRILPPADELRPSHAETEKQIFSVPSTSCLPVGTSFTMPVP